jgi:hypothetical protein
MGAQAFTWQRRFERAKAEALRKLSRMSLEERLDDAEHYLDGLKFLSSCTRDQHVDLRRQIAREFWEVKTEIKQLKYAINDWRADSELETLPAIQGPPIEDRSV